MNLNTVEFLESKIVTLEKEKVLLATNLRKCVSMLELVVCPPHTGLSNANLDEIRRLCLDPSRAALRLAGEAP